MSTENAPTEPTEAAAPAPKVKPNNLYQDVIAEGAVEVSDTAEEIPAKPVKPDNLYQD